MATAMQVILLEDLTNLGKAGDLVKVKPGYARNYLLPQEMAIVADVNTIASVEKKKAKLEEELKNRREKAKGNKSVLDEVKVVIKVRAGTSGKLFGSVTKEAVAQAIFDQHEIRVDKHKVRIDSPIRVVGEYAIKVGLDASGVEAGVTLNVEAL